MRGFARRNHPLTPTPLPRVQGRGACRRASQSDRPAPRCPGPPRCALPPPGRGIELQRYRKDPSRRTTMERLAVLCVLLAVSLPAAVLAEGRRPMTIDDLFRFKRVADPQISPDGKLGRLRRRHRGPRRQQDFLHALARPRRTSGEPAAADQLPARRTAIRAGAPTASRSSSSPTAPATASSGSSTSTAARPGSSPRISTEAGNGHLVARRQADRLRLRGLSRILRQAVQGERRAQQETQGGDREEPRQGARSSRRLFFRHWDSYVEDKRQHLFVMPSRQGGEPRDVTPGDRDAYPTSDTSPSATISPSAPTASTCCSPRRPSSDEAWSTNYDICRVPVAAAARSRA